MAEMIVPAITALQAQAQANYFLLTHLGDRFVADDPVLDAEAGVWRVPVLLAYPLIGPVGDTGVILVNSGSEEIVFYTPLEDMKAAARALYETHRDEIEASVP